MVRRRFLGTDTTESDLLAAVAQGELEALGEIYRRNGAAVLAAARKVAADPLMAEAITAEVFVELWDGPESVSGDTDGLRGFLVARALAMVAEQQRGTT